MGKWIFALVFISGSAFAAKPMIAVNADVFYKGEKRSSARLITQLEQEAEIISTDDWGNSQSLKIFVQEIQNPGQKSQYKMDTVFKVIEDGKEKFVSKPQIIALEDQEASIEVGDIIQDSPKPEFKLTVKINKKN